MRGLLGLSARLRRWAVGSPASTARGSPSYVRIDREQGAPSDVVRTPPASADDRGRRRRCPSRTPGDRERTRARRPPRSRAGARWSRSGAGGIGRAIAARSAAGRPRRARGSEERPGTERGGLDPQAAPAEPRPMSGAGGEELGSRRDRTRRLRNGRPSRSTPIEIAQARMPRLGSCWCRPRDRAPRRSGPTVVAPSATALLSQDSVAEERPRDLVLEPGLDRQVRLGHHGVVRLPGHLRALEEVERDLPASRAIADAAARPLVGDLAASSHRAGWSRKSGHRPSAPQATRCPSRQTATTSGQIVDEPHADEVGAPARRDLAAIVQSDPLGRRRRHASDRVRAGAQPMTAVEQEARRAARSPARSRTTEDVQLTSRRRESARRDVAGVRAPITDLGAPAMTARPYALAARAASRVVGNSAMTIARLRRLPRRDRSSASSWLASGSRPASQQAQMAARCGRRTWPGRRSASSMSASICTSLRPVFALVVLAVLRRHVRELVAGRASGP